jgi:hypothetical protein
VKPADTIKHVAWLYGFVVKETAVWLGEKFAGLNKKEEYK